MAWYRSATQTMVLPSLNGTGQIAQYITALTAICGEASFGWQVASTNQGAAPHYIVLKRKNGAAGRIYVGSGVSPAASTYYQPGAGVDANMPLWGYDYSATSDTPTQSMGSGPPFGGTGGLNWRGSLTNRTNRTVDIRGYWNAAEDIVVFVQTASGANVDAIFAVGKFLRDDSGTPATGMTTCGQGAMGAAWPPLSPVAAQTFGTTAVSNMVTWAYDPSVNGVGGWLLLEQTTNTAVLNRGSYTADTSQYTTTGGIHVFYPINFVPTTSSYPWAFNRRAYATRFIAYGPPKNRDYEWLDNASASQGYYLGYTGAAATDRTCLSLINYDF